MGKKHLKETTKYILRSYPIIKKYVEEFDSLYSMSEEELLKRNERQFIKLFRIAYAKSSFYKKLYSDAGISIDDIRSLEDIKKLPIITKDMVRSNAEDIRIMPKWMYIKVNTSGTTGIPLSVYETWPSIWREQASIYYYRQRCGYTYGKDVMISLRGHLSAHDVKLWVKVSKTLFLSSYNLRKETTKLYHDEINKVVPKCIEGYPSALYTFACNLDDLGLSLNIPLCFTSSEKLLPYQRVKIEKVLNTKMFDMYGSTERTIQLVENFDHNGYFEVPGYSINEFVEDGEITTSLINYGFPLIRYKGNDIIHFEKGRITEVEGRTGSSLVGKDGTRYTEAAMSHILSSDMPIVNAQFVQYEIGKAEFNVVLNNTNNDLKTVASDIKRNLEKKFDFKNIDIEINFISESELCYTKAGKFNFIVQKSKV